MDFDDELWAWSDAGGKLAEKFTGNACTADAVGN
jgi:hypothetical protein